MKTISKILILLLTILPISLLAHDGHVHTGTLLENVAHFILTNGYIVVALGVIGFFILRLKNKTKNVKIK